MKKFFFTMTVLTMAVGISCQKAIAQKLTLKNPFIEQQLTDAITQYNVLQKRIPEGKFPRTYTAATDAIEGAGSNSWISGFYPGTLLYLYEFSNEEPLLAEAQKKLDLLEKEKNNKGTHDLGFMLYCSFGNAYRLTGDERYKNILLTGAGSLISRYNPTVGCIKSWDHGEKWKFPVIIDNMMNLEYLDWASEASGDKKYKDIAITHANTTLKNHFRPDYSSYHVIDYDPETGNVLHKQTHQGAADSSAWARGQTWGLYGYTMMYRLTKNKAYLDQAGHIAEFILHNPNLPEDRIPFWDFDAPGIPNTYRDASAAAVMASALLELSQYVDAAKSTAYLAAAETMIKSLSAGPYKANIGSNGGFILQHSVGHLPGNSEIDVPLSYADYYYVEALIRYHRMLEGKEIIL